MAVSNSLWPDPGSIYAIDPRSLNHATITHRILPEPSNSLTEAMLSNDVFSVPVEALVDIWVLRFGHSWVNLDDIENDEFFRLAYTRLKSLGQLEVHYLTDRAKYVCRKPA